METEKENVKFKVHPNEDSTFDVEIQDGESKTIGFMKGYTATDIAIKLGIELPSEAENVPDEERISEARKIIISAADAYRYVTIVKASDVIDVLLDAYNKLGRLTKAEGSEEEEDV